MPHVEIAIGGRTFEVACQDGEEQFLTTAAAMLDEEARHISEQVGRMPEARMLLMAGLMLADKTAGLEERVHAEETRAARLQARIDTLESAAVGANTAPDDAAPAMPEGLSAALEQIAVRAEVIAGEVERRVS